MSGNDMGPACVEHITDGEQGTLDMLLYRGFLSKDEVGVMHRPAMQCAIFADVV